MILQCNMIYIYIYSIANWNYSLMEAPQGRRTGGYIYIYICIYIHYIYIYICIIIIIIVIVIIIIILYIIILYHIISYHITYVHICSTRLLLHARLPQAPRCVQTFGNLGWNNSFDHDFNMSDYNSESIVNWKYSLLYWNGLIIS